MSSPLKGALLGLAGFGLLSVADATIKFLGDSYHAFQIVAFASLFTLPLIVTMRDGNAEQAAQVRQAIQQGGSQDIEGIRAAVEAAGALDYTARLAQQHAELAIACLQELPDNAHRQALIELTRFAVARSH